MLISSNAKLAGGGNDSIFRFSFYILKNVGSAEKNIIKKNMSNL